MPINSAIAVFSVLVALGSLSVSIVAMRKAIRLNDTALKAAAADRALHRFSRFNELLFQNPKLHDIFMKHLDAIEDKSTAKAFVWFVLNQMEGVYMDYYFETLAPESFACYDKWLRFRLGRAGALRDFLTMKEGEYRKYFAEPYRKYLEDILELRQTA